MNVKTAEIIHNSIQIRFTCKFCLRTLGLDHSATADGKHDRCKTCTDELTALKADIREWAYMPK